MAKDTKDVLFEVEEKWNRVEHYLEDNKKQVSTVTTIIVLIVLGYLGFTLWYLPGQEQQAELAIYPAQRYFDIDSVNKAIPMFQEIADDYSWTKAGHTANYYLGICYYKKKDYQKAIDYLDKFDAGDIMVSPVAAGVMGDAELQLGDKDKALADYLNAVKRSSNDLTTPIYLKKAGFVCEMKGDYTQAISLYETIKTKYHTSQEALDIDKYIARARIKAGVAQN